MVYERQLLNYFHDALGQLVNEGDRILIGVGTGSGAYGGELRFGIVEENGISGVYDPGTGRFWSILVKVKIDRQNDIDVTNPYVKEFKRPSRMVKFDDRD